MLQHVTVSTRWRKGLCSIKLSSETEIRVLSLEPHGTHIHTHAQILRCALTHTQRHTSLLLTHGLTCIRTHCACLSLNNQRMPACLAGWLAGWMLRGKSDMNPVWCLFFHSDNSIRREDGPCASAHTGQKLCQIPRPQGYSERKDTLHDVTCMRLTRRDKAWPIRHLSRPNGNMTRLTPQEGCLDPINHGCTHSYTQNTLYIQNMWVQWTKTVWMYSVFAGGTAFKRRYLQIHLLTVIGKEMNKWEEKHNKCMSLKGLMGMKMIWIICCGFHSHPISIQLNTCGFWTGMLDSAVLKTQKEETSFGRMAIHPSSRVLQIISRSTEDV